MNQRYIRIVRNNRRLSSMRFVAPSSSRTCKTMKPLRWKSGRPVEDKYYITMSYSLTAARNMMRVTSSKQWIHFRRSLLCPPTSIWKNARLCIFKVQASTFQLVVKKLTMIIFLFVAPFFDIISNSYSFIPMVFTRVYNEITSFLIFFWYSTYYLSTYLDNIIICELISFLHHCLNPC